MTPTELTAGLRRIARESEDVAVTQEAQAAACRPEYERCLATATPATHERALELYPYVIPPERDAVKLRADAALLRAAAELIEKMRLP